MPRILVAAQFAHPPGGGAAVVAIGDVEFGNCGEQHDQPFDQAPVRHYPEGVANPVVADKVVFRPAVGDTFDDPLDLSAGARKVKDRFIIGVQVVDMLDAVLFLVGAGVLVFLDHPGLVVVHAGADHQSGLGDVAHPLAIDVERITAVLYQDAACDELLQVGFAPEVNRFVVRVDLRRQVDLGAGYVQKTVGIAGGHAPGFLDIHHVVGQGGYFFSQLSGGAQRAEWFDDGHI